MNKRQKRKLAKEIVKFDNTGRLVPLYKSYEYNTLKRWYKFLNDIEIKKYITIYSSRYFIKFFNDCFTK